MAQTAATPEEEYKKLIKVNEDIQPLGDTPFGERISLYDGSLSFSQTDVTVSGTGPTITVGREFSMHGVEDRPDLQNRAFGDWDMELPQIFTVTANQQNVTGWEVAATNPKAICSSFREPPSVAAPVGDSQRADWEPAVWWQGYQLRIPGQGSQDLLSRSTTNTATPGVNGLAYPIVTRANWAVGCLPQASNDATLEGFLAVSPDGTKYWLDHIAYRYMPSLTRPLGSSPLARSATSNGVFKPQASAEDFITRREGRMLVTRVEDRFGNWITYGYTGDQVTDIAASDGRHVTLTYEPDSARVSTVTVQGGAAGTRTWTYSYVKSPTQLVYTLTSVVQPDGSSWGYNLIPLDGAWPDMRESGGTCGAIGMPSNLASTFTATMTHPSGLSASYTVAPLKRGRSYVYRECMAGTNLPNIPDGQGTWAVVPNASYSMAVTQRVLSGAGLPAGGLVWSYGYSAANESWQQDCTAACATTVSTDVSYPDGHLQRSTFSNRYDWTESQLQREDIFDGAATTALRQSTVYSYVNPDAAQDARAGAYVHPWGYAPQDRVNIAQLQEQLPMATRQVVMDPAASATPDTYTWNVTAFDAFARPGDVTRSNNLGYTVSNRSTYADSLPLWVIGLPAQSVNLTTGETVSQNVYDTTTMTLAERDSFGRKVAGYTFNAQGQLASFTDGNSNTTTIASYIMGIPSTIAYADGTTQAIAVDGFGQIAGITDQAGATTTYGYDAIGRVARIDYPSGDTVAWAPKTFTYALIGDARGMGGAHWERLVTQGALSQRTDFDVLLRPVMTGKYETGTSALYVSGRTEYDWKGRKTFESYPVDGSPDRAGITLGVATTYDVLGRPVSSTQSSELGDLISTTAYTVGAARQVTDPKGNVTTSHFQVFDEPSFDAVVGVTGPEGVSQTINRDVYGNVLSLAQGGITKTMTYDSEHRVCRSWEPESGSTMYAYDNANNVIWSAAGQAFNGEGCGYDQVPTTAKTVTAYDALNRVTAVTYPNGALATSFTYDALGRPATAVSATSTASANNTGSVGWAFGRNKLGLLTAEVLFVDGWSWGLGYGYDANGVLSAVQYPNGETIASTPNALGQPTAVGMYATGATYFPDGELQSFAAGNGALYSATKNARNLMANFTYGTAAAVALSEDLAYDPNGNILTITDRTASSQRTKSLAYDGLSRLVSATASNLWGTESYTYDTLNNIRTLTDASGTRTYAYDANNLLSSISTTAGVAHAFAYDTHGNTVSKDTQQMSFDLADRLLAVTGKGEYMYDASGHRVKAVTPSATTYYAYSSAGQLMWEYDNATANGTSYIYLGGKLVASKKGSTSTVIGSIDGVTSDANATITGWACATGIADPIGVQVTLGGPAGTGTALGSFTANQPSDDTIQTACHSSGTLHRFAIALTEANRVQYAGQAIYIDGMSPVGGANGALTGSGSFVVPASILAPQPSASVTTSVSADLSTLTVSWAASANVTSYTLERSYNGEPWPSVYEGAATSVTLPVAVDGNYVFRVKACNANGCSEPTVSNTVTVAHIPTAPAAISVPGTSTGSIAIGWSASTYATSYSLEQSVNGGGFAAIYSGPDLSFAYGVGASATYTYRVQACNANGCSGYGPSGSSVITIPPASAPAIAGGGTSTTGAYSISWAGVAGAATYNLLESANGGALTPVQNTPDAIWSTSGRGDGTYVYQVQACNAGGCGPFSGQVAVTVSLIPATPAQPSITQTNPDYKPVVHVTWVAVAGATRYEVLETEIPGTSQTVYNGSDLTWSELKYFSGTLEYSVRACNAVGCSAYSSTADISLSSGN